MVDLVAARTLHHDVLGRRVRGDRVADLHVHRDHGAGERTRDDRLVDGLLRHRDRGGRGVDALLVGDQVGGGRRGAPAARARHATRPTRRIPRRRSPRYPVPSAEPEPVAAPVPSPLARPAGSSSAGWSSGGRGWSAAWRRAAPGARRARLDAVASVFSAASTALWAVATAVIACWHAVTSGGEGSVALVGADAVNDAQTDVSALSAVAAARERGVHLLLRREHGLLVGRELRIGGGGGEDDAGRRRPVRYAAVVADSVPARVPLPPPVPAAPPCCRCRRRSRRRAPSTA